MLKRANHCGGELRRKSRRTRSRMAGVLLARPPLRKKGTQLFNRRRRRVVRAYHPDNHPQVLPTKLAGFPNKRVVVWPRLRHGETFAKAGGWTVFETNELVLVRLSVVLLAYSRLRSRQGYGALHSIFSSPPPPALCWRGPPPHVCSYTLRYNFTD